MRAVLAGNRRRPELRLTFPKNAQIPRGVTLPKYPPRMGPRRKSKGSPTSLHDWVQMLPMRFWDPEAMQWVVTDPGVEADRVFAQLGFTVDLSKGAKLNITALSDLATPLFEADPTDEFITWMFPRFSTGAVQLPVGVWDKEVKAFAIYTPDLAAAHLIDPSLEVPLEIAQTARQLMTTRAPYGNVTRDAKLGAYLATAVSRTKGRSTKALQVAHERFGVLPEWFGMTPFGYQECGQYSVLAGHSALADPPGLGKTIQSIGAHQLAGTKRLLIVCPQKVRTTWARELEKVGMAYRDSVQPGRGAAGGIVVLKPGPKKVPPFPDRGVVIISDSLLASNSMLRDAIMVWAPDGLAVDEAHRLKSWDSARSRAVRGIAQRVGGLRIAATGTPLLSSPHELAPILAITGHLETVFGGYTRFMTTYSYRTAMGGWAARKSMLPQLRQLLDEHVWVRRNRKDAYIELADETDGAITMGEFAMPKPMWVDVDLAPFLSAHREVVGKVDEWLESLGYTPGDGEVEEWAGDNIGLVSLLRKGAGMAKVPAAAEFVQDWVDNAYDEETGQWADPLIVWTHHRDVTEAMIAAVNKVGAPVASLWGGSKASDTEQVVDDFQAGKIAVIVASMTAAGTGLTLTKSRAALFVETDWTPANVQQASDRIQRIGQRRATSLTMMVAEGTLDERIQQSLSDKAKVLDVLLGDGNDVSVMDGDSSLTARDIVATLVAERVKKLAGKKPAKRKVA